MLTPVENFKLGFLTSCAAQGMTVKQAEALLDEYIAPAADRTKAAGLTDWIPSPPSAGTVMAAGLLPVAAVGGGMYLGNALGETVGGLTREPQLKRPLDVKQVQNQELIAAYRAHTQKIKAELAKQQARQNDPVAADIAAQDTYGF